MNEYVKNDVVKIVFFKPPDNGSGILTKNLSAELHEKHLKKMVGKKHKDVPSFKNV